jgi:hypothetical protein
MSHQLKQTKLHNGAVDQKFKQQNFNKHMKFSGGNKSRK